VTQAGKPGTADLNRFEPAGERGPIEPFDFDPQRYVFISYLSDTDPDLLRAIVRSLLRRRVSVWMYDPTPCRLTEEEDRAVQSQEEDQKLRPGVHWKTLVTDAITRSSCMLVLVGRRSKENQMLEIEHAISKGHYHAFRIDDVPDSEIPEKLRERLIRKVDVNSSPDVIAAAVQRYADIVAKEVLGDDFKPVKPTFKPKAFVADGRLGLVAAAAIVVLGGGAAAMLWGPGPSPPVVDRGTVDPSAVQVTGPRLALVITQTEYNGDSIRRVVQAEAEGKAIRGALDTLNFDITNVANKSKTDLEAALEQFRKKLEAAGPTAVAFIYYTGHGIQHPQHTDNLLLGTDAQLASPTDIERYGVSLRSQMAAFDALPTRGIFMVFDACRNVPTGFKSTDAPAGFEPQTKGLVRVIAPSGMLVAYATEEGDVAQEGFYAPILAEELVRPNQIIETAFVNTKNRVATRSGHEQLPWNDSKIREGLCLSCSPARSPG
jgi:hypothetical protein